MALSGRAGGTALKFAGEHRVRVRHSALSWALFEYRGIGVGFNIFRFGRTAAAVLAVIALAGAVNASGLGFRLLTFDGAGVKWVNDVGRTSTVTYAIVHSSNRFPNARNCKGVESPDGLLSASGIDRQSFDQEVRAAFDMWEQAINITFREIDDPAAAGIVIGAQSEPEGHAFANVDYKPGDGHFRQIDKSLICLNPKKKWKVGFGGSLAVYDLRYTIAHEIGHAIGLDHPDSGGQLMSFTYSEQFRSLQEGDVEGAIRIYGSRMDSRSLQIDLTRSQIAKPAITSAASTRRRG